MDVDYIYLTILLVASAISAILTYFFQTRIEEMRQIKRDLHNEKRKIYIGLLEPQIKLFSNIKNKSEMEKTIQFVQSYDYRKIAFELNLYGSDDVINANNEFMQFAFKGKENTSNPSEIVLLWGKLLLEIRKDLGNEKTKLTENDMLKSHITDIEKLVFKK